MSSASLITQSSPTITTTSPSPSPPPAPPLSQNNPKKSPTSPLVNKKKKKSSSNLKRSQSLERIDASAPPQRPARPASAVLEATDQPYIKVCRVMEEWARSGAHQLPPLKKGEIVAVVAEEGDSFIVRLFFCVRLFSEKSNVGCASGLYTC